MIKKIDMGVRLGVSKARLPDEAVALSQIVAGQGVSISPLLNDDLEFSTNGTPYPIINRLDTGSHTTVPVGSTNIEAEYVNLNVPQSLSGSGGYKLYYKILYLGSVTAPPELNFYLSNISGTFSVGKLLTLKHSNSNNLAYFNELFYLDNYSFLTRRNTSLPDSGVLELEYYVETANTCVIDLKILADSPGSTILDYSYSKLIKD